MEQFYILYQRLLSETKELLNETQLQCLANMKEEFNLTKQKRDESDDILEGIEKQKETLENEIENLTEYKVSILQKTKELSRIEKDLLLKIKKVEKIKNEVEVKLKNQQARLNGTAIGKGIYKKKYSDAIEIISKIHDYSLLNKCKTKESIEKNIRIMASDVIAVCEDCKNSSIFCKCE